MMPTIGMRGNDILRGGHRLLAIPVAVHGLDDFDIRYLSKTSFMPSVLFCALSAPVRPAMIATLPLSRLPSHTLPLQHAGSFLPEEHW
jgi:hypothetical protein